MKREFILLGMILFSALLMGFPARIQSWDIIKDVKQLNKLQISIGSVNHLQNSIIVELRDEDEFEKLFSSGYSPERLPDVAKEYYQELLDSTRDGDNPLNEYHSIDEYHSFMQNIANQYPEICQLHQWGTSVQNRPLYIIKISDYPDINESEPEVKLIGSIHGDETVGYEMLIRTIELLCESYGTDPRITNIVDNTELWINPLYNPDGYVLGQRFNANGVDLNRNFPMPNGITNPDGYPTATENLAMMDFSNQHNFVSGINFHGGALVINYPWDYSYTLAPDNDLIVDMALTYSTHNSPMFNSDEFNQGITNGAQWYVITGSMQDWNYGFTSNIELTAEISNIKWPPASTLDTYWNENRESILSFIEYAQNGVQGVVMSNVGVPASATIKIEGNSRDTRNDPLVGDYHRMLLPGEYTITASAEGHLSRSEYIVVPPTGFTTVNFWLSLAQQIDFTGFVRDRDGFPISGASIVLYTSSPLSATTDANGSFSFNEIYEGDYRIQVSAPGYALFSSEITLRKSGLGTCGSFILGEALFEDGFEENLDAWNATSPWNRMQQGANWVLADSPTGNYSNNSNRSIRLHNPVSLVNIQNPSLSFKAKWDLEAGYDYVYVEGSTSGSGNWQQLGSFTGNQETWADQVFALDAFANQNFYLRFRLDSDWGENADGIYIDDVQISGTDTSIPLFGDADSNGWVSIDDAQHILDYMVGNSDTISEINANLDLQEDISGPDAYLIYLYSSDPAFRFPAQSEELYNLEEVAVSNSLDGTAMYLTFTDSQDLHSFYMDSPFALEFVSIDYASNWIQSVMRHNGKFAMIGYDFWPTHMIELDLPDNDFYIQNEINGYLSSMYVEASSHTDPDSPALTFALAQNYPNPFNPNTSISFSLASSADTSLKIYNLKGQIVATLAEGILEAGNHTIDWDGRDNNGNALSSGIYFYRLQSGQTTLQRKMVLSK